MLDVVGFDPPTPNALLHAQVIRGRNQVAGAFAPTTWL
jgi:hypothetical protein